MAARRPDLPTHEYLPHHPLAQGLAVREGLEVVSGGAVVAVSEGNPGQQEVAAKTWQPGSKVGRGPYIAERQAHDGLACRAAVAGGCRRATATNSETG